MKSAQDKDKLHIAEGKNEWTWRPTIEIEIIAQKSTNLKKKDNSKWPNSWVIGLSK